jgi:hypothetical protein
MSICTANEEGVFAHLPQASNEDISRDIGPQMAEVALPIGVGQAARN